MTELKKHCDTCLYSYIYREPNAYEEGGSVPVQRCSSADYNGPNYTNELLMEDWGRGYCRFWTRKNQNDKTKGRSL